eukprot:scaffold55552_cov75-Cyclotella_meneghiniana.AAC.4
MRIFYSNARFFCFQLGSNRGLSAPGLRKPSLRSTAVAERIGVGGLRIKVWVRARGAILPHQLQS